MEEYKEKVEELSNDLFDHCQGEIKGYISDPDYFLFDVLSSSNSKDLPRNG